MASPVLCIGTGGDQGICTENKMGLWGTTQEQSHTRRLWGCIMSWLRSLSPQRKLQPRQQQCCISTVLHCTMEALPESFTFRITVQVESFQESTKPGAQQCSSQLTACLWQALLPPGTQLQLPEHVPQSWTCFSTTLEQKTIPAKAPLAGHTSPTHTTNIPLSHTDLVCCSSSQLQEELVRAQSSPTARASSHQQLQVPSLKVPPVLGPPTQERP